jgi:hypothetical protein
MKNLFSTLLIFSLLIKGLTAQELLQKIYGELGSNEDRGECIIATADGGSLVAGKAINPTTQFFDAFLLKLDANGEKMWYKTFESAKNTEAHDVIQSPFGGFIFCGSVENEDKNGTDAAIWKVDNDGNLEWEKVFDSPLNESFTSITRRSNGEYMVAGYSKEYIGPNGYSRNKINLMEVDEDGILHTIGSIDINILQIPLKIWEKPNNSIDILLKFNEDLEISNIPIDSIQSRKLAGFGFSATNTKNFQVLIDSLDRNYFINYTKEYGIVLNRYEPYIDDYWAISIPTTGEGTFEATFLDNNHIKLIAFEKFNTEITSIKTYIIDIRDKNYSLTNSLTKNFNLSSVHSVISTFNGYTFLMNDTIANTGEMDFRVLHIEDSTQNYQLKWEQVYGLKSPNQNETFVRQCTTKKGNQIALAQRYNPDFQYFILKTDKNGNKINESTIAAEFLTNSYKILDIKPTPDDGVAILSYTNEELHLWKISSAGVFEWEKEVPVNLPEEFNILIVRPDGYAFFNQNLTFGGLTYLYLFDNDLNITGYRKITSTDPGFISNGVCLENGGIMLFGVNTSFIDDSLSNSSIKTILTDKYGYQYKENYINSKNYFSNGNDLIQVKLIKDNLYVYPEFNQIEILKINSAGVLETTYPINSNILNYESRILDLQERTCRGIMIAYSYTEYYRPEYFSVIFQAIGENGISSDPACLQIEPSFETCNESKFVADYTYTYWNSQRIVDNSTDLVFHKITYPKSTQIAPQSNKLRVLQNPTSAEHLCLALTNNYEGDFTLQIFNTEGRLMQSYKENKLAGLWENSYFVPGLSIGTYFIKAQIGADNFQAKWINISK